MPKKRFTKEFLYKLCKEQNITLLSEYHEHELNAQKFIDFKCVKCNKDTSKRFEFIIKYTPRCHNCSYLDKGNKARKTILERYGVSNISQLEEIKNKKKETTLKNYGVEHNSQSEVIKNKKIQTCINNLGVEHPQQSQKVRSKTKENFLINYGVEYPLQSEEIMEKAFTKSYNIKTFKLKSGKEIKCQGYEPFALNEISNYTNENDVITGAKNVPKIWYYDASNKKHKHYVDIYIPSKNKCIEVKSTWTIKQTNGNIFLKQNAAKELGYEYEIWVYDKKGNKVETYN